MRTHPSSPRRRTAVAAALVAAVAVTATGCGSGTSGGGSAGSGDKPFIALSNGFIGNGWRQTMIAKFEAAATKAQSDGLIGKFKVVNAPGENSATEQVAQIKSLLLQKPDALLIDPASPTALKPVIQQACDAGIKVVVFDSAIDAPCAHVLLNSFKDWATAAAEPLVKGIGGKGTVIVSRGVVGSQPEAEMYQTTQDILGRNPGVKVAATVNGMCDGAKAQKAVLGVLSSVPKVDGVIGCGDGYGVAQAFTSAGKPVPAVTFETNGRALKYWQESKLDNGSVAVMSDPGQSVAALWEAIDLLDGKDIPKEITFPIVLVEQKDVAAWAGVLKPDEYAAWPWTQELFRKQVEAAKSGGAPVQPPIPTTAG
ncbi:ABC transporter substrate-binding protein [Micromonospora sagamiensis]|uniref:Monosaccharide ABC transporter substrate-binding protein, CUT2 family (TC 3.A.1.2.-) n=1 Tax=Micromonospora sagamiensis TaxID=47875 RepID=A0A562WIQ8_9ACTN|nr:ABC transporter substrate-binding protein [Micromonospora sagamiensis]TWJ30190.1 monosaccharide ABC transporter substrate-binding protein, CUT2 family (TC 3.A.1.2.-) [Micromonospora sagamiensis]BCL16780.1 ABC transporter substrate-binding protein [Micromonospora sagamiensis]